VFFADSEETVGVDGAAANAVDGDMSSFWQTQWYGPAHPHELQIDLGGLTEINALRYVPRQDDKLDGTISGYEVYASPDCASWELVASGTWQANRGRKLARFAR
jgi:phospholipase C